MLRAAAFVFLLALTACAASPVLPDLHALPDPRLTPGATDPRVTQANIASTICTRGYTRTVRPPSSFTAALKRRQIESRGLPGGPRDYEEDHLIPLELGGAPADERNLWPEPWNGAWGARVKDRLENRLHALVCARILPLDRAQSGIADDWISRVEAYP